MLLAGPPTITIFSVPLPEKVPLAPGFRTSMGIGASDSTAPHDAIAPTSIVRLPESRPTKNDWIRSVTVTRTNGLVATPVSKQMAGGGLVPVQLCTPGTDAGKSTLTSVEGEPAVSPVAL